MGALKNILSCLDQRALDAAGVSGEGPDAAPFGKQYTHQIAPGNQIQTWKNKNQGTTSTRKGLFREPEKEPDKPKTNPLAPEIPPFLNAMDKLASPTPKN